MRNPRSLLLLMLFLLIAGAAATVVYLRQHAGSRRDEFDALLNDLCAPEATNRPSERPRYLKATDDLIQLGTNALPRLMWEVRRAGMIESTNREATPESVLRIRSAFRVLSTNARPLVPELIGEFQAGRSIAPAASALSEIGGTDAGFALVSGLTNSNSYVRYIAIYNLSPFKANREVAIAAAPFTLLSLQDASEGTRVEAANLLGILRVSPETVIPALRRIAETDSDRIVRAVAIKAIGRHGTNGISAEPTLEKIVTTDEDTMIRRVAGKALQAVRGQIAPGAVW